MGVGVARWRAVGVACAAVVLGLVTVVGCSADGDSGSSSATAASPSSSVVITGPEGTATMQNPAPYLSLWNPCSLPKSVTEAVGLQDDPGVSQLAPWQFCEYKHVGDHVGESSWGINVGVTSQPFGQVKRNSMYSNQKSWTMADGREAFVSDTAGVGSGPGRAIVWGTTYGSVAVSAFPLGGGPSFDAQPLLEKFVSLSYEYIPK